MLSLIDEWAEPLRLQVTETYENVVSKFYHPAIAEIVFLNLCSIGVYWSIGFIYFLIDYIKKPNFFYKYKIQRSVSFDYSHLEKIFKQILFNQMLQLCLGVIFVYLKYKNQNIQHIVPKPSRLLLEVIVLVLCREIGFYYSHRLLHHRMIYKHIHKRHHEYQSPIAWTAIYCHPIEHILSNILPVAIGPMIMHSHNLVNYVWMVYVIVLTLNDHCGYHFPWNFWSPVFHDFHHLKFNVNYGVLGICDWLHGTDKMFRQSKYWPMHRVYFTLNPPKEFYYAADKMK